MNHSCARRALIIPVAAALVLGGAACTNDRTDTSTSTSQTTSAAGGSTHDRVEKLLDEAEEAFDAPARTSSAGNTDKTVDNMSIVADRLMQAHELAPYRNDLLFSAASAQIARKDVEAALALYKTALATAPMMLTRSRIWPAGPVISADGPNRRTTSIRSAPWTPHAQSSWRPCSPRSTRRSRRR